MSQSKENKKWTREEAEQNKNKLLEELKELPTSQESLEWVTKELNQLIDEEEIRQNTVDYNVVRKAMEPVPFVDEVEVFNRTMGNQTPTPLTSPKKKNGCLFIILF